MSGKLMIKVTNNATALTGGGATYLAASNIGYWGIGGGVEFEVDNTTGLIQAFTLSGPSGHSNNLQGATRFGVASVTSVQVGYLTQSGGFSTIVSS